MNKFMRRAFLLISLLLLCNLNYGQDLNSIKDYTGPVALGPFSIGKTVLARDLYNLMGQESPFTNECFCYRKNDAYFWFEKNGHSPKEAGAVTLSSFPNCIDNRVYLTKEKLPEWKTEKGIKLGSSVQEVLKVYGRPSKDEKIVGKDYWYVIHRDYGDVKDKSPEIGDRVLAYSHPDVVPSAAFGIRDGKVVWISMSNEE
jgi:hypothetical protein